MCGHNLSCVGGDCLCAFEDPPQTCDSLETCCNHIIPEFGGCVNTLINVAHCGRCNHPCVCAVGICVAKESQ